MTPPWRLHYVGAGRVPPLPLVQPRAIVDMHVAVELLYGDIVIICAFVSGIYWVRVRCDLPPMSLSYDEGALRFIVRSVPFIPSSFARFFVLRVVVVVCCVFLLFVMHLR